MAELSNQTRNETSAQSMLPEALVAQLTPEQRIAFSQIMQRSMWSQRHPVNIRVTVPFIPRPFFLTVVAGWEKRGRQRRRDERANHPLMTLGNVLFTLVALAFAAGAATIVYGLVQTLLAS